MADQQREVRTRDVSEPTNSSMSRTNLRSTVRGVTALIVVVIALSVALNAEHVTGTQTIAALVTMAVIGLTPHIFG